MAKVPSAPGWNESCPTSCILGPWGPRGVYPGPSSPPGFWGVPHRSTGRCRMGTRGQPPRDRMGSFLHSDLTPAQRQETPHPSQELQLARGRGAGGEPGALSLRSLSFENPAGLPM